MSLFDTPGESAVFELGIDETAKAYMLQTARWTRFMAIMGFVGTGLMILVAVFIAMNAEDFNRGFSSRAGADFDASYRVGYRVGTLICYLALIVLYLYPIICLFKFSKNIKAALLTNNTQQFNTAMKHQRNMWRFMGILMIVLIGLYGVIIGFYAVTATFQS